jgi:NAD(P)-dependent dehydrogenase (short-subunit alcohol dehydrogenase family)
VAAFEKMVKMGYRTTAEQALQGTDLTGKVAVVTGGNSGIGTETVRALALAGADVVLCSRSPELGEAAAAKIRATGVKGKVSVKPLDLADLASVRKFAADVSAELPRLDLLILNAGVMACPLSRTKQGFEMQIGTNHVGHYALTDKLLPKLRASGTKASPARIVAVASTAHAMGAIDLEDLSYEHGRKYAAWSAYGQSKLANILFAKQLAVRLEAEGAPVTAVSLHPGVISTGLSRHMGWLETPFKVLGGLFMKSIPQGAATTIVAATAPDLPPGAYLADCKVAKPTKAGEDMKMAAALWDKTEALIKAAAA